jgi:hypothetical protein
MATMRTVPASPKPGDSSAEYWRVSIEHNQSPGHTIAPYMDRPRVFCCRQHEAEAAFKKFYGIRSTPHILRVDPATERDLFVQEAAQAKRDNVPYSVAWAEWEKETPENRDAWLKEYTEQQRTKAQAA